MIFPNPSFRRMFDPYRGHNLHPVIAAICTATGLPGASDMEPIELARALMEQWAKSGVERWEGASDPISPELLELFGALFAVNRVLPFSKASDYTLVTGATLRPQARKAQLLIDLVEGGYNLGTVVHTGSADRELRPNESMSELLIRKDGEPSRKTEFRLPLTSRWNWTYETEFDMMRALNTGLNLPPELQDPVFIPVHKTTGHRANTGDGFAEWKRQFNPPSGTRVLVVSINPHAMHQFWNAQWVLNRKEGEGTLGDHFHIEVAAPSALLGPQTLYTYMGALARGMRFYTRAITGRDARR